MSAEMARLLWPSADALGRCLYVGRNATDCTTIVGIVRDVRRELKDPEPSLDYYVPLPHDVDGAKALVVRSERPELGARAANLVRLVLAQALLYAAAGVVVGVVLSLIGARYVAPMPYETSPRDTLAPLAAALALVLCSAAACIVPARAAARADPRQALQSE